MQTETMDEPRLKEKKTSEEKEKEKEKAEQK